MNKKYSVEYEDQPIVDISINHEIADEYIKEMVEFWMDWEKNLARNNGDYTKTWLEKLCLFILRRSRLPIDDEGWYSPIDEKYGFDITYWEIYEFNEEEIGIKTI